MEETTQVMSGAPSVPPPTLNALPQPPDDKGKSRVLIAAIIAGLVAIIILAAAFVIVSGQNNTTQRLANHTPAVVTKVVPTPAPAPKPTVIVVPGATPSSTVPPGVSYSSPSAGWYAVDANISATNDVSSSLANNVFYQYWNNGGSSGGTETVSAWSSATGQYYNATCVPNASSSVVDCFVAGTTDPNAEVSFPLSAVQSYTQADADAFVSSGASGP